MAVATATANEIAEQIVAATILYHNEGETGLTDDEFDALKARLKKLDPKNPALRMIGAPVKGEKVQLPYWMPSLDKIKDDPKVLEKFKKKYTGRYVVSDKLDGNSGMYVVKGSGNGKMLYTRGDGEYGQDIKRMIPFIKGIPSGDGEDIAVRGELIISKANWEKIKDKGANARNVVAGALHTKVPNPEIAQYIDFVAYELLAPKMIPSAGMKYMADKGFNVVYNTSYDTASMTFETLSEKLMERRRVSPYEVDGIVVVHDAEHRAIKGKNPGYGFAMKSILLHDEAEVIVSEVEWNVSKDGYLKPIVHFPGVVLAGAKIQKASGFNAKFIQENGIGPGARIVIIRSGDVIPHIVRILSAAGAGASMPPGTWKWNESGVDAIAEGGGEQMMLKTMQHFVSSLDVKGVGPGTLQKLYDAGAAKTIPELLRVSKATILTIPGFKEKSAATVYDGLQNIKATASCVDLMVASNIFGRGLGKTKLNLVVAAVPEIAEGAGGEKIAGVPGIGKTTAVYFMDCLPRFFAFMKEIGIKCKRTDIGTGPIPVPEKAKSGISVSGLTIVFTGVRDKDVEVAIAAAGGKVTGSVSKNTDVVVAKDPEDATGKVQKARELGVKVVSLGEFVKQYAI